MDRERYRRDGLRAHRWRQRFDASAGFLAADISYVVGRHDGRLCAAYRDALGVTCFRYAGGAVSELEHIGVGQSLTSGPNLPPRRG